MKLIEGGSQARAKESSRRRGRDRLRSLFSLFSLFSLRQLLRRRSEGDAILDNLHLTSRVLWAALVLLGCYIAADVLLPDQPRRAAQLRPEAASQAGQTGPARPEDQLRPLSVYVGSVGKRNPFTAPGFEKPEAPRSAPEADKLQELTQGLTVVGIDRSGTPRALIEDTKLSRTYFVRVGEQVNGLTVKQISEGGVVLGYEGREIELPY